MKQQIATDTSQSTRLIACSIDPKSADMVWQEPITTSQKRTGGKILVFRNPNHQIYVGDVPAWSLSALLALLPIEINDKGLQTKMQLEPCLNEDDEDAPRWAVSYYDYYTDANLCYNEASDPIGACVKAIEWLTQNGYKLNWINQ